MDNDDAVDRALLMGETEAGMYFLNADAESYGMGGGDVAGELTSTSEPELPEVFSSSIS